MGDNIPPGADLCVHLDVRQVLLGQRNIRGFRSNMGLAHHLMHLSGSFENSHLGPETGRITN